MSFRCRRRGATLTEVAVVIGLTGALMGLLLPALSSSIANSQGSQCRNNLARLAQALNAYHDAKGKFPPSTQGSINSGSFSGNTKPNWVILTLPYMGEQALYDSVNWTQLNQTTGGLTAYSSATGVNYGAFTSTVIASLLCPSDSFNPTKYRVTRYTSAFGTPPPNSYQSYGRLNYASNARPAPPFAYSPPSSAFAGACGGPEQQSWDFGSPYSFKSRGVMGFNTSVSRAQITDGTSKTILIGDTRAGVNAADPRGIWADGRAGGSSVWFHIWGPDYCSDDLGPEVSTLLASLGPNAGQYLQQQCMSAFSSSSGRAQGTFRSLHGGGILVAMCDGSVRFVSDSVERGGWGGSYDYYFNTDTSRTLTWERLNASADGLVVDDSTDPNFSSTAALFILGDMNGDGVLDNFDISAMELALADPAAYLATYPTLTDYQQRGDIDQNGSFDNFDIGAFEIMLAGSR